MSNKQDCDPCNPCKPADPCDKTFRGKRVAATVQRWEGLCPGEESTLRKCQLVLKDGFYRGVKKDKPSGHIAGSADYTNSMDLAEAIAWVVGCKELDTDTHLGDYVAAVQPDGSVIYTAGLVDHVNGDAPVAGETHSFTVPAPPADQYLSKPKPVTAANGAKSFCFDLVDANGVVIVVDYYCQPLGDNTSVTLDIVGTDISVATVVGGVTQTGTLPIADILTTVCATDALKQILKDCLLSNASLQVTKVAQPLGVAVGVGDIIKYTVTITSTGDDAVTNITLTDDNATVTGGPIATLASGASDSTTFVVNHTITQAEIDAGSVTNQLTASGLDPNGGAVTGLSSDTAGGAPTPTVTQLPQNANLTITKKATPSWTGTASAGDTIAYEIVVTNTGSVTLTGIQVVDPLIPTFTPAVFDLASSASTTFNTSYTLKAADITAGKVDNQATATGTKPVGGNIVALSDDPANATNVDTDGDGNPDDVTTVNTADPCASLSALATVAITDAVNGQALGSGWTAVVAGVPMTAVNDALNGQLLYYILSNNACAGALPLVPVTDAANGQTLGYVKA